jgi:hypothetical protein
MLETVVLEALLFDPALTWLIAREDLVHRNLFVTTYSQKTCKQETLQI